MAMGITRTCSGGQPHGEGAGEVLDENRDEALERPAHRAVNDHRPVRRVVLAGVAEIETLRRVVVELDGAQLPRAADGIGDIEVDLGTVEGAVPFLELVRTPRALERARSAASARSQSSSLPMRCSGRVANLSVAVSPNVS
jgi:hypothetical protein